MMIVVRRLALLLSMIMFSLSAPGAAQASAPVTINVYAASSLYSTTCGQSGGVCYAFNEMVQKFQAANPRVSVNVTAGSSSALASTIANSHGVVSSNTVDVFASADMANMLTVINGTDLNARRLVSNYKFFASNHIVAAYLQSNSSHITSMRDLNNVNRWIRCAPSAPCGATTVAAFRYEPLYTSGLTTYTASSVSNVTNALKNQTTPCPCDVAMVYHSDVVASRLSGAPTDKRLGEVTFSTAKARAAAKTIYPIATLNSSSQKAAAKAFADFVLSKAGQKVMAKYGFRSANG